MLMIKPLPTVARLIGNKVVRILVKTYTYSQQLYINSRVSLIAHGFGIVNILIITNHK